MCRLKTLWRDRRARVLCLPFPPSISSPWVRWLRHVDDIIVHSTPFSYRTIDTEAACPTKQGVANVTSINLLGAKD